MATMTAQQSLALGLPVGMVLTLSSVGAWIFCYGQSQYAIGKLATQSDWPNEEVDLFQISQCLSQAGWRRGIGHGSDKLHPCSWLNNLAWTAFSGQPKPESFASSRGQSARRQSQAMSPSQGLTQPVRLCLGPVRETSCRATAGMAKAHVGFLVAPGSGTFYARIAG